MYKITGNLRRKKATDPVYLREQVQGRLAWEDHPLIVGIRASAPHLVESGALDALAISAYLYVPDGELIRVLLYGRFRPGRDAASAGLDFEALMDRLSVPGLSGCSEVFDLIGGWYRDARMHALADWADWTEDDDSERWGRNNIQYIDLLYGSAG